MFEVHCERVLTKRLGYEVRKEKSDKEPDLFFTKINKPLEVKLTSTKNVGLVVNSVRGRSIICWFLGEELLTSFLSH